jgi:hypothetical protein
MKYNEIELYKFFVSLTYDEHFGISETEMYSYLKYKTDNFDLETFNIFRKELNFLSCSIKFIPPQQISNEDTNVEITLLEFHEKFIITPAYEEVEKNENTIEYIKKLGKYVDLFINEYDARMKIQEIQSYFKDYDFGLIERYKNIIMFSDLVFSHYDRLFTPIQATLNTPPKQLKQPLTFSGLFKKPHNQDLELFKKKLQECNLIDSNYQWREVDNNGKKTPKNDIGKFFNWLYAETTVFSKTTDPTNESICFCKEFGVTAYKEGEKPSTGRIVTVESITKAGYDKESGIKYNTHFKTWINKEK